MPDLIDPTIPAVYKALGDLKAEADRTAAGIDVILDALKELPSRLEDIVKRATQPLTTGMDGVKQALAEVQTAVNKWKAALSVVTAALVVIGWAVQGYIALRSAWKSRGTQLLAARMTDSASGNAGNLTANRASSKVEPAPATRSKQRRALLVDDSPDILIVAAAFLSAFDFDVVCAASAEEALFVLAHGAPVDLLVTDYAMPGMNGKDLVEQARERNHQLRALIISGYSDSLDLTNLPDGVRLLAKPFRRTDLYNCILSVIEPSRHLGGLTTTGPEIVSAQSPAITEES